MAQTKKKRRRKQRGTQGGRIDRRPPRGRARSKAEAQARARSRGGKKKSGPRVPDPPSRNSALKKGGIAAVLFIVVLALFGQSPAAAVIAGIVIFPAYALMSYFIDRLIYRRFISKEAQKRSERESQRAGGQAGG
ncbi:MAG TPA: hypothetical protein VH329_00755 [Solirubrobacterales bacterium]